MLHAPYFIPNHVFRDEAIMQVRAAGVVQPMLVWECARVGEEV